MVASRVLPFAVAAGLWATLAALPVAAQAPGFDPGPSPALVVDADSGKVLYEYRATDPWFPASITKLMTVYVALERVHDRKIRMDSLLTVSARAKASPPSKMNFKPGSQIRLDNALKILMVKSANDVAVTIAEGVGGSVDDFAELMNDAAQRLGMRESNFVNPHGLPDSRQQTSARDMAILARALINDFPEQRDLFSIGAVQFGRRVMQNTNGLIGRYPGADGMKTGFICSSGFNVVATATRHGKRLITVVLGSPSAAERTFRAGELFDQGFNQSSWGLSRTVTDLAPSVLQAPPDMRPFICNRRGPGVPSEEEAPPVQAGMLPMSDSGSGDVLPPTALAFASVGAAPGTRRRLGPRTPFDPIPVWLGASPGAAATEEAELNAKPVKTRPGRMAARPAVSMPKPVPSIVEDDAAPDKPSVTLAPSKPKARPGAIARESLGDAAKPVRAGLGSIARKPVSDQAEAASPAAKPAAKPAPARPATAKPIPAKPLALAPKPKPAKPDAEN